MTIPGPSRITLALTSIIASLALCGCNRGSEADQGKPGSQSRPTQGSFTIGMSQCNLGEPWRVEMNAQIKTAAERHPNLHVVFKDAQNDTLQQRAHVEEFVSAGVDLIIISPKEAQPLTRPIAKAMEAGIPVIILDRRVIGTNYT